jgi:hypothetical protein
MDGNALILFGAIVAIWFVVNRWVLPSLGVPTCMSGGCSARACGEVGHQAPASNEAEADKAAHSDAGAGSPQ